MICQYLSYVAAIEQQGTANWQNRLYIYIILGGIVYRAASKLWWSKYVDASE